MGKGERKMSNQSNTKKSQMSQEDKKQIAKRIDVYYNIALDFARQGELIGPICLNLRKMHDLAGEIGLDVRELIDNVWTAAPVYMSQSKFYNVPSDMDADNLLVIVSKEVSPYYRIVQKGHPEKTIVQARKAVCDMFVKSSKNLQKIIRARKESDRKAAEKERKAEEKRVKGRLFANQEIPKILLEAKRQFNASGEYGKKVQELIEEAQVLMIKHELYSKWQSGIQDLLDYCLGFGGKEEERKAARQIDELEQSVSVEEHSEHSGVLVVVKAYVKAVA